ncbi:hypothetical protein GCM10009740_16770 [Terrabacter terrae]|uniref:PIN domain-containing protein n=1 Tax=Terrabacter terrae TaxID=318434 RepID=A0ABP5FLL9_9MICO
MGIQLPLHVNAGDRDRICRALLEVTRHRLQDITVDVAPQEGEWPEDVEWAAVELEGRIKPKISRLTGRTKVPMNPTVDLDPSADDDFAIACALAAHTWMTVISADQSIALDTETFVELWVSPSEYVELVEHVRESGGDVRLLEPDPGLKPIYT